MGVGAGAGAGALGGGGAGAGAGVLGEAGAGALAGALVGALAGGAVVAAGEVFEVEGTTLAAAGLGLDTPDVAPQAIKATDMAKRERKAKDRNNF